MDKKKKLLIILGSVLLVAILVVSVVLLLRNVGKGATAEKPISLSSGLDFDHWFGGEKSAVSRKEAGTYYFKLSGDITVNTEGLLASGHTVVLDLDGHTISGGKNRVFSVTNGSLILKNGTVKTAGADADGGLLCVKGAGCNLELEGMVLTNTDDTHITQRVAGGVLFVTSPTEGEPATLQIRGTTVINGSASGLRRSGGSVALAGNARMFFREGFIRNGQAPTAGNISMEGQSVLYMLGGTISGGKAVRSSEIDGIGGNIYAQAMSRIYLYAGYVADGTADVSGGNIFLSNTGSVDGASGLYMLGGTVEAGVATECGGNLYASESHTYVRIYGGNFDKGDAMMGGNIYLHAANLELWGGTLTGIQGSERVISGSNIYGAQANLSIYDGLVENGMAQQTGGNIYVLDTTVNIYGGLITDGCVASDAVNLGGGNLYAGKESTVNMYGGLIQNGVSNVKQNAEVSAAGGNVMIAGKTVMHMYGGTIKNGKVYGTITRGGSMYVCGQTAGSDTRFYMHGGTIENGALENTMRGMCVGSYSETKGTSGKATTYLFGGDIIYTGPEDDSRINAIYGNKTQDLVLYNAEKYEGIYRRITVKPCADPTHSVVTATQEAGCLTPGYQQHDCATCGTWYTITDAPTGHSQPSSVEVAPEGLLPGHTQHSCTDCGSVWYSDPVLPPEE